MNDWIILVVLHDPNGQALSLLDDSFRRLHDVLAVGLNDGKSSCGVALVLENEVVLEQYLVDIVEVGHAKAGLGDAEADQLNVRFNEQLECMDAVDGVGESGLEFAAGLSVENYFEASCPILADDLRSVVAFRKDGCLLLVSRVLVQLDYDRRLCVVSNYELLLRLGLDEDPSKVNNLLAY